MIWRADTDKAHRCPGRMLPDDHPRHCEKGYVSCEETGWHFRRLHVYACRNCGMRVTVFPGWPHYPGTEHYWSRFRWYWTRGIRYDIEWTMMRLRFRIRRWAARKGRER